MIRGRYSLHKHYGRSTAKKGGVVRTRRTQWETSESVPISCKKEKSDGASADSGEKKNSPERERSRSDLGDGFGRSKTALARKLSRTLSRRKLLPIRPKGSLAKKTSSLGEKNSESCPLENKLG